ncbi:hypothetical protein GCM10027286_11160 [Virgibacillus ainsalahensis]
MKRILLLGLILLLAACGSDGIYHSEDVQLCYYMMNSKEV